MPCQTCTNEGRCDRAGLCQDHAHAAIPANQPKACVPGRHCERYARGLGGCVAGYCNPPKDAQELLSSAPRDAAATGVPLATVLLPAARTSMNRGETMPCDNCQDPAMCGDVCAEFVRKHFGPQKCDGNHAGPPCADVECWNGGVPRASVQLVADFLDPQDVGHLPDPDTCQRVGKWLRQVLAGRDAALEVPRG